MFPPSKRNYTTSSRGHVPSVFCHCTSTYPMNSNDSSSIWYVSRELHVIMPPIKIQMFCQHKSYKIALLTDHIYIITNEFLISSLQNVKLEYLSRYSDQAKGLDMEELQLYFREDAKNFCLLQSSQTGGGVNPASYAMDTALSAPVNTGNWQHTTKTHLQLALRLRSQRKL